MRRTAFVICIFLLAGFAWPACTRGVVSCQTIYNECEDKISKDEDDFVEDCVDEFHDEDEDCKDAMSDFAECVHDEGCDDPSCTDEYWDIANDCGFDALQIPFAK